jgi:hypothetical protein
MLSNARNSLSSEMLKRCISIGFSIVYIDTGSPVPSIPSKSCGLADENNKPFDGMKMIRNKRIPPLSKKKKSKL